MRLIFAGTPAAAVPTLIELARSEHEIVGVITRTDAPQGRKRTLTQSHVAQAAAQLGIETYKTNHLDAAAVSWAQNKNAHLGVIVAYGALLKKDMLQATQHGWINLHFSKLPQWRGAAPVQRALMAGETELGMSVFRLTEGLDDGPIITTAETTVPFGITADMALEKLSAAGSSLISAAISEINVNPHVGITQNGQPSYAPKLTRADGQLDFSKTHTAVLAHWSAVTSEPGAYSFLEDNKPLKIHALARVPEEIVVSSITNDRQCGSVFMADKKVYVMCADKPLELITVQPAGKAKMPAADWFRGRAGKTQLR